MVSAIAWNTQHHIGDVQPQVVDSGPPEALLRRKWQIRRGIRGQKGLGVGRVATQDCAERRM